MREQARGEQTTAAMPIGTLTKKIQCQSSASVSTPPASRPIEAPAEPTKPKTPIAFACSPRLREHRHDHPEDHGGAERAADALHEARGDQHLRARCQPAQQRGEREHGQAGEEDLAAADQVAEPAGEQQQAAERDQVRVDDPGQAGGGEAEVAPGSPAARRSRSSGRG